MIFFILIKFMYKFYFLQLIPNQYLKDDQCESSCALVDRQSSNCKKKYAKRHLSILLNIILYACTDYVDVITERYHRCLYYAILEYSFVTLICCTHFDVCSSRSVGRPRTLLRLQHLLYVKYKYVLFDFTPI